LVTYTATAVCNCVQWARHSICFTCSWDGEKQKMSVSF